MVAFSQDIFNRICERIAEGESLREICEAKDMPARVNFIRWLEKDEALRNQYARARELQADHEFDEIKAIADLASVEDVQVARLRVDTRKWRAGKLRPKVYGDKVAIGGADDLPPIQTNDTGTAKLAAYLDAISSRAAGQPTE
jgi:hypothetical protein